MLTSGMDDIDISVSGAEMMNSSQMMQALTMFQSFYGIFKNYDKVDLVPSGHREEIDMIKKSVFYLGHNMMSHFQKARGKVDVNRYCKE